MKNLRNLITAILWVWGIASVLALIGLTISVQSFTLVGLLVGAILCVITYLVYSRLNDDL